MGTVKTASENCFTILGFIHSFPFNILSISLIICTETFFLFVELSNISKNFTFK